MARIRSIKPELPQSESMGNVSRDARLLFILLWTVVDDSGVTRGNSRMLASLLFPYDDDAPSLIEGWLSELEAQECVVRYKAEGQTYLQIRNWLTHQKIDKPTPSKLPQFENPLEDSRKLPVGEEGKGVGEEGKGKEGSGEDGGADAPAPRMNALHILTDLGVDKQHAQDWLAVRKAKKAPLTHTALDDMKREAVKAGISLADAVAICARRNWQGFNASWNWKDGDGNDQRNLTPAQRRMAATDKAIGEWLGEGAAVNGEVIEGECHAR